MRAFIIAALAAGVLAACTTSGGRATDGRFAQFQEGKSTIDEVIAALGQPNSDVAMADGSRQLVYTYRQRTVQPRTPVALTGPLIPFTGPVIGGPPTRTRSATLRFDERGVLESVSR